MKKCIEKSKIILAIAILILGYYLYIKIPGIEENFTYVFNMLRGGNTEDIKRYIISFGTKGPIISIMLLVMQAIIAPLPAFIITFVNAYIYGWKVGTIISCIGTLIGACLCFFISRYFGRPVTEKFIPSRILDKCNLIFDKYGKHVVYASRLLPFISFDGVSYAAGLTKMSFKYFFVATAVGQIPLTIVISRLGAIIYKPKLFIKYLSQCAILGLICMCIMYVVYRKKYNGINIRQIISNLRYNK